MGVWLQKPISIIALIRVRALTFVESPALKSAAICRSLARVSSRRIRLLVSRRSSYFIQSFFPVLMSEI